eukprot:1995-Prymnesium_polylepis.1
MVQQEPTPASESAQRPVSPSAAMPRWRGRSRTRELSGQRIARADRRGWVGGERWVIAPAAVADRRRLLGRCRSVC